MATTKRGRGTLLVIGGAEDPDDDDLHILPHLVKLAGGRRARLLVGAAATEEPDESLTNYHAVFQRRGVAEVRGTPFNDRCEGEDARLLEQLERARRSIGIPIR